MSSFFHYFHQKILKVIFFIFFSTWNLFSSIIFDVVFFANEHIMLRSMIWAHRWKIGRHHCSHHVNRAMDLLFSSGRCIGFGVSGKPTRRREDIQRTAILKIIQYVLSSLTLTITSLFLLPVPLSPPSSHPSISFKSLSSLSLPPSVRFPRSCYRDSGFKGFELELSAFLACMVR